MRTSNYPHRARSNQSDQTIAYVLIAVGIVWLMNQLGFGESFPFSLIRQAFHSSVHVLGEVFGFLFSWPVVLLVVGAILLAGRRKAGVVLIAVGLLFLIPRAFVVLGVVLNSFLPLLVIGAGVLLLRRNGKDKRH